MKKFSTLIALTLSLGLATLAHAAPAGWTEPLQEAVKTGNYNQINVIGASNPQEQGAIALWLLKNSQEYKGQPERQVKVFAAATPFVGRIPPAEVNDARDVIANMLKIASDKKFQDEHPREAGAIFIHALNMSGQPNVVANDPNLHAEVLEAANDFIKAHPDGVDKKLIEEVSLAEAGGAPETPPRGVINPSAE